MHSKKMRLLCTVMALALFVASLPAAGAEETGQAGLTFGDVNGDTKVDPADALAILQHTVKLSEIPAEQQRVADVNMSDAIDATDALHVLQKSVELIEYFSAEVDYETGRALSGIFNRGTLEQVDEEHTAIGSDIGLHNADMVWVGGTLYAYYPAEDGIHLAKSSDGIEFTDSGVVIPSSEEFWAAGGADNPSVFVDQGTYYLAYDGTNAAGKNSICLATSSDGVQFQSQGEILFHSGMGAETVSVSRPDIMKDGSTWYLTYTADNGTVQQICVACGRDDLYSLDRLPGNPVLKVAPQGYDSGILGRRDVIYADGMYYMVYETATQGPAESASWSHSFAKSPNMVDWSALGRILLPATEQGYGMDQPNFMIEGMDVWVYYREGDGSRRAKLDFDASRIPEKTEPVDHTSAAVAATLDGLFTGKTTEQRMEKEIGGAIHMHFPDFLKVGDEIWAYYIGAGSTGKMSTRLAVSTDGVNFEDRGVVVEPTPGAWDSNMSSFAGVWLDDGVYYLVYEGSSEDGSNRGAVGLATSTDGIHFEKQGKILDYTGMGIEAANVGTPDLYKEGDTWYLFYHCFDFQTCQVCVATGPDLFHLTRAENNPVIPTVPGRYDAGTTGRRDVIYSGGWYYMVYEVSTEQPYGEASWGHTFARSKDLIHWDVLGKLLYPATGGGMGHDGPNWYVDGDDVYVYFRARDAAPNSTTRTKLVPIE